MQFAPSAISRRVSSRLGVRRGCLALLAPLSAEALSPSAVETVTGEAGPQTDAGAIGGAPMAASNGMGRGRPTRPRWLRRGCQANLISGGTGSACSRDKLVFEVHAHLAVGNGIFFEPVVQYVVNGDPYWNPHTDNRSKDGVDVDATRIVPLAAIFGLAPG